MGIRAVIDLAVVERVGDVGTFEQKLNALAEKGYVGEKQKDFLAAALDAGSAAAHRGHRPKASDLDYSMDIVENMLQALYVLEEAADQLRKATPPRPPRAR
jgi:hypothetical protein